MSLSEKIPELIDPQALYASNGQEAWRVLGIMSEFTVATERLRGIRPAVSMFGSARIGEGHPYYAKTCDIARRLSDAGFAVISGGGPGLMEAANRGAFAGRSPAELQQHLATLSTEPAFAPGAPFHALVWRSQVPSKATAITSRSREHCSRARTCPASAYRLMACPAHTPRERD